MISLFGASRLWRICELHNRARTRDLGATYTNPLKRYLSAVGRDYELHKVFYPAYRPILHPYHPSRYKFLGGFLGFLMDSPLKSASFLKVK